MGNNCLSFYFSKRLLCMCIAFGRRKKKSSGRLYHGIALLRNGLWSSLTGATSHAKSISTLLALFQNCNIYQKSRAAAADRLLRWQLWLLLVSLAIEIRYYRHLRVCRGKKRSGHRSHQSTATHLSPSTDKAFSCLFFAPLVILGSICTAFSV